MKKRALTSTRMAPSNAIEIAKARLNRSEVDRSEVDRSETGRQVADLIKNMKFDSGVVLAESKLISAASTTSTTYVNLLPIEITLLKLIEYPVGSLGQRQVKFSASMLMNGSWASVSLRYGGVIIAEQEPDDFEGPRICTLESKPFWVDGGTYRVDLQWRSKSGRQVFANSGVPSDLTDVSLTAWNLGIAWGAM